MYEFGQNCVGCNMSFRRANRHRPERSGQSDVYPVFRDLHILCLCLGFQKAKLKMRPAFENQMEYCSKYGAISYVA